MSDPSIHELRECMRYEPESGLIYWLTRKTTHNRIPSWNSRFAGKVAGAEYKGYLSIAYMSKNIPLHRVCWALFYNEWPKLYIDHINGDKKDNRIANLRLATAAENCRNSSISKNNTSGRKGVSFYKSRNKWEASIMVDRKNHKLGYFDSLDEASNAYDVAAIKLHREFARTNADLLVQEQNK